MNFFKKGEEDIVQTNSKSTEKEAISSIIDKDMNIVGDISFKGKTRIDGKIDGNIKGEYLILSETAIIEGDISASTVVCQGKVNGNIKTEKFYAKKPTNVTGKLETKDLSVESGATLNGEIHACQQKLSIVDTPKSEKIEVPKALANV